jgi:hypothetical protein
MTHNAGHRRTQDSRRHSSSVPELLTLVIANQPIFRSNSIKATV